MPELACVRMEIVCVWSLKNYEVYIMADRCKECGWLSHDGDCRMTGIIIPDMPRNATNHDIEKLDKKINAKLDKIIDGMAEPKPLEFAHEFFCNMCQIPMTVKHDNNVNEWELICDSCVLKKLKILKQGRN